MMHASSRPNGRRTSCSTGGGALWRRVRIGDTRMVLGTDTVSAEGHRESGQRDVPPFSLLDGKMPRSLLS